MPGKAPVGIFPAILIEIVGGGFLSSFSGLGRIESFDLGGIFIITVEAIVLLIADRFIRNHRAESTERNNRHGKMMGLLDKTKQGLNQHREKSVPDRQPTESRRKTSASLMRLSTLVGEDFLGVFGD
jgi:uncharacterized membrane protein YeaQ/YmgE (transglycosylase-associated protein family)